MTLPECGPERTPQRSSSPAVLSKTMVELRVGVWVP
jgi:hypothetical protein